MKRPFPAIVVDANVLIAAARGRSSGALLAAASSRRLLATDRSIQEARRRIELGLKRPELLKILDALAAEINIVTVAALTLLLPRAQLALKDAAASRNGSTQDAHLLALAWNTDADLWSFDRDFAGTGVASWSTPNLMRALAETGDGADDDIG